MSKIHLPESHVCHKWRGSNAELNQVLARGVFYMQSTSFSFGGDGMHCGGFRWWLVSSDIWVLKRERLCKCLVMILSVYCKSSRFPFYYFCVFIFYKEMTIITNQLSWADNGYPLHNEVGCLLQELAWLRPKPEVTSHVPCHPYLAPTNHHSPAPESFCTPAIAFLAKHGLWNGGAWSSVFRCASVSIKDSLLSTPVIPSFCHIFGFPFCQRLWALTKHRDDSVVGDMVDDMVGDKEVHMVADMEVDKVADMVADMAADKKKGRHWVGHGCRPWSWTWWPT